MEHFEANEITKEKLQESIKQFMNREPEPYCNPFLVSNRFEWLHHPLIKWTEEEIDNADEKGLIGTKYGVDCYLSRYVKTEYGRNI